MNFATMKGLAAAMSGSSGVQGFRSVIENADNEVAYLGQLVPAGDYAVERLDTAPPGQGVNVMVRDMPWKQKLRVLPIMFRTVDSVATCGKYMMDKLTPSRADADETIWQTVQQVAAQHGAIEVGFAKINENDIFKEYAIPYQNAVVFTIDMKKSGHGLSPKL